jgi:hypothetical protein
MTERKKLTDIVREGKSSWLTKTDWSKEERAQDFGKPIPRGTYSARIVSGELAVAKKGPPFFNLTFEIADGPHKGRKLWYPIWLTDAARSQALRDFDRLGISGPDQLENGLPAVFLTTISVVIRKNDDDSEKNEIRTFTVTGIEKPEADPFRPDDEVSVDREDACEPGTDGED